MVIDQIIHMNIIQYNSYILLDANIQEEVHLQPIQPPIHLQQCQNLQLHEH